METLRHLDKAFQAKESETQPRITDSAKSSTIIERERKKKLSMIQAALKNYIQ